MIEYYPDIKLLHVLSVVASGSLFLLRGVGVQIGAAFAMAAPVRFLSYTIDTVLLCAALLLVWTLQDVVLGSILAVGKGRAAAGLRCAGQLCTQARKVEAGEAGLFAGRDCRLPVLCMALPGATIRWRGWAFMFSEARRRGTRYSTCARP